MTDKRIRIILDSKNAEKNANDLDKAMVGVGKSSDKVQFSVNKLAAAIAAALAVDKILAYADAFTTVQNQIRRTTSSQQELTKTTFDLLQVANDTRTGLQETTELYTSLAVSTQALGYSQEQVIGITKTINNLFLESGKTAAESAGAIRQLGQALQSGALRGDEFNSIAEGAPGILRAIQKETGKTAGELRAFAATGGITAELLTKSLENYSDAAQKAADKTQVTLGQAMVVAKNNATIFVGSVNEAVGITSSFSKEILNLSASLASQENIANFVQFFKQSAATIDATTASLSGFSEEIDLLGNIGSESINLLGRAFRDLLPNIKSLVQILTVEVASAIDKVKLGIVSFGEIASHPFDDEAIKESVAKYNAQLEGLNLVREQSIAGIFAERDAIIQSSKAQAAAAGASGPSFFGNKTGNTPAPSTQKIGSSKSETEQLQNDLDLRLKIAKIYRDTQVAEDATYYEKKSALLDRSQAEELAKLEASFQKEQTARGKKLADNIAAQGVNAGEQLRLQNEVQAQSSIALQAFEAEKTAIQIRANEERAELNKEESKSDAAAAREIQSAKRLTSSLQEELAQRQQASRFYSEVITNDNLGFYEKSRLIQADDESKKLAQLESAHQEELQRQAEQMRQVLENERLSYEERAALKAEFDAQMNLSELNHVAEKNAIRMEGVKAQTDLDKAERDARLANAGELGNALMNLGQGQSKKIFKIGQNLALAQTAVSLPTAVMESFKNGGGMPWGLIPAATMAATGMKNIQQIKSAGGSLGGGGGGSVSMPSLGSGSASSNIPTTASSRENAAPARIYDFRNVKLTDKITVESFKELLESDGAIVAMEGARQDAQRRNVIGVTAR